MSGYVEKHLMPQHYQGMFCNFMCNVFIQTRPILKFYIHVIIALSVGVFVLGVSLHQEMKMPEV
jgi:hypothetical protein